MQRRDFLKTTLAALLARFIDPAPRPQIDLLQFCDRNREMMRFDLRQPFNLDDWTYATNAFVCVRVRPESADRSLDERKIPPFETLSWNHDRIRGWRPMPKLEPIEAADSSCLTCDGYGHLPAIPGTECERCYGTGDVWVGSNYHLSYPRQCKACGGKGYVMPAGCKECPMCRGNAIGTFPALVKLDGVYYDRKLYERVQALGGEYVQDNWHAMRSYPLAKFRFAGGDGLLMGVDAAMAEKRIRKA